LNERVWLVVCSACSGGERDIQKQSQQEANNIDSSSKLAIL